jgi:hypothetical protein
MEAKAKAHELRASGCTLREIAAKLRICETTAGTWCRFQAMGAAAPVKKAEYSRAKYNPDIDDAIMTLCESGYSRARIAETLCLSVDQVRSRGRFLGVYQRDRRENPVWDGMYGPDDDGPPPVENRAVLPFEAISPLGDWRYWDHGGGKYFDV